MSNPRFEYKAIKFHPTRPKEVDMLNSLGDEGWEVCAYIEDYTLILKRQKAQTPHKVSVNLRPQGMA